MIPEPTESSGTVAARGAPASPPGVAAAVAAAREIDELSFLVGTSCSRAITLLMQSGCERAALRDELRFLADKAGRLAVLLGGPEEDDPAVSAGRVSRTEQFSDTIVDDGS